MASAKPGVCTFQPAPSRHATDGKLALAPERVNVAGAEDPGGLRGLRIKPPPLLADFTTSQVTGIPVLAIVVLGYVDSQVDGAVARTRWRRTRGWPARLLGVALIGAGGWLWRWPEQGDTICLVLFFIAVGVHLAGMAQSDP